MVAFLCNSNRLPNDMHNESWKARISWLLIQCSAKASHVSKFEGLAGERKRKKGKKKMERDFFRQEKQTIRSSFPSQFQMTDVTAITKSAEDLKSGFKKM